MGQYKLHINLPLEAFILKLKKEGFEVDVTTYLHIQKILLLFKEDLHQNPEKLKSLLCPVIARSQEEQHRFSEIFDHYFKEIQEEVQAETATKKTSLVDTRSLVKHSQNPLSKILLACTVLIAAGLFCYALYALRIDRQNPELFFETRYNIGDIEYSEVGDSVLFTTRLNPRAGELLKWDLGDSTFIYDSTSFRHIYSKPGLYEVKLERSYKYVPYSDYTSVDSICLCKNKPQATFQYQPLESRKGRDVQCIQFSSKTNYTESNHLEFLWNFGDGTSSKELNPTHEFTRVGKYIVNLKVTDTSQYPPICQSDVYSQELVINTIGNKAVVSKHTLSKANPYKQITVQEFNRLRGSILVFLPVIVFLLLELYLYRKRRFKPSETITNAIKGGDKPPYEIPFPNQNNKIHQEKDQHELANKLRQRIRMTSEIIDIKETVITTIKNSGFPILRYKFISKPPEYLFLIDRSTTFDQHALLTKYLTEALLHEGVLIETFYYRYDPRICHNEQFPEGIVLEKLKDKFPDHKLIIVGSGHQFLQKKKAILQPWVKEELGEWKQKVLLSTHPKEQWSYKEKIIQENISLLSADMEGCMAIMETLHEPENSPENDTPPNTLAFNSPENIAAFLNSTPLFQWLCATALYPRISWEIMLSIGHQLSSYYAGKGEDLEVNYSSLHKLSQVTKGGEFTNELRGALLKKLDPEVEQVGRKALSEILGTIQMPAESFLSEELETQKLYNNFILNPTNKEYAGNVSYLLNKGFITDKIYREYFSGKNNTLKNKTIGAYFKPFRRFSPLNFVIRLVVFCFFISIYFAILIPVLLKGMNVQKEIKAEAAILNNNAVETYEKGNTQEAMELLKQSASLYLAEKDSNAIVPLLNQKRITYNTAVDFYSKQAYAKSIGTLDSIKVVNHKVMWDIIHLLGICSYYTGDTKAAQSWYGSLLDADSNYFKTTSHPDLKDLLDGTISGNTSQTNNQTNTGDLIAQHATVDSQRTITESNQIIYYNSPKKFINKYDNLINNDQYLYPISTANENEMIMIPDNVTDASVLLWQNINEIRTADSSFVEFLYSTYDDDGSDYNLTNSADGIAVHLGRDQRTYNSATIPGGSSMTFIKDNKGLVVFFKIFENRQIILMNGNGTILAQEFNPEVYTNRQYVKVKIALYPTLVNIYLNDLLALQWKGELKLSYPGIGIGAATGQSDAEHKIKNARVLTYNSKGNTETIYEWSKLSTLCVDTKNKSRNLPVDFFYGGWIGTYELQMEDLNKNSGEWMFYGKLEITEEGKIRHFLLNDVRIDNENATSIFWGEGNKFGFLEFNGKTKTIEGSLGTSKIRAIPWK